MSDTAVYFVSRVFSFSSSLYSERESKHIKEKTRKCVKDYHQSSSFVAESMMFFFFFFVIGCRRQWCNITTTLVFTSHENRLPKAQYSNANVWINKRNKMHKYTLDWTENRFIHMYFVIAGGRSTFP